MIADNSDVVIGEHAWTKLLEEQDIVNKGAVFINISNTKTLIRDYQQSNSQTSETSPLTSEQHDLYQHNNGHYEQHNGNKAHMGNEVYDSNKLNASLSDKNSVQTQQSILGTFHRHLRRSLSSVSESPGPITRYRQTRFGTRRVRKRVIFKHGDCNVVQGSVVKRNGVYLQDIFTTLVDAQWRWTLLVFALSFLISWAFFGLIWWTIAYVHGDLEWINIKDYQPNSIRNYNLTHTMCVTEVRSFTSAFLYSIETQHTIGYGNRYVTEQCPEAVFTMCLQCIIGVFIQAFMVGIVFAKLSRPKKRAQTLLFSRNAVICHRDGVPCLMFRVGDMRKSHIIEAHVRAQIIRKKVTKEGEILPFFQQELQVGADGDEDRLMFIWPTTIVHKIDRNSPLYMLSASDMLKDRFEVVCMLEGVVESTGMTTQARSSYLPSEILWGHRFVNVVSFCENTGEYEVDYTLFNNTYDVDVPQCSAKELDNIKREYANGRKRCLDHVERASHGRLDVIQTNMRSNSIPDAGFIINDLEQTNNNNNNTGIKNKSLPTFTMGETTIPIIATKNYHNIKEKTNSNINNRSLFKNINMHKEGGAFSY